MKVKFNLEKKYVYLIVSLLIIVAGIFAVKAYGTGSPTQVGHTWNEIANIPSGFSDGVDNTGGSTAWADISGIPSGFSDGVDNTGGVVQNGWSYVTSGVGDINFDDSTQANSKYINFPIPFSSIPDVVATQLACRRTSQGAPTSKSDFSTTRCCANQLTSSSMITDVSTTGFRFITRVYDSCAGGARYVGFSWMATE